MVGLENGGGSYTDRICLQISSVHRRNTVHAQHSNTLLKDFPKKSDFVIKFPMSVCVIIIAG